MKHRVPFILARAACFIRLGQYAYWGGEYRCVTIGATEAAAATRAAVARAAAARAEAARAAAARAEAVSEAKPKSRRGKECKQPKGGSSRRR